MKKGEFNLEGKAIDCRGLSSIGNFGQEIFRALKVACNGVDSQYCVLNVSLYPYMVLSLSTKTVSGCMSSMNRKVIQPSDVLGQHAIDAAMDGATIVFNGDNLPLGRIHVYYDDGEEKSFLIDSPSQQLVSFNIIAYKLLDEKQPSIESKILAEKVGSKHDQGKPLYNLIPVHAEAELVDVLTFGATKYAPNQWRSVDNAKERYTAAAMRHLAAYRMGEESDPESGKHHLAHAMCCLSFIIELDLEN